MSGSGGGGGPPPRDETDCARLSLDAEVASPQPRVVARLTVGELLSVELDQTGGRPRIIVRTSNNDVVGALLSSRLPALLRCLQQGEDFAAEVTLIAGGDVRVKVRHK